MATIHRASRYSAWDGSQDPLPVDAEQIMDRLSEDIFSGSDFEFALRRAFNAGWRMPGGQRLQGLEELVDMVRRRRLEQLNRYNLEGVFDDIRERLDKILATERRAIRERLESAPEGSPKRILEKVATPKLKQLDELPPEPGSALRALQDYEWMDPGAEQKYRELMDELQRQVGETYFRNLNEGMQSLTPEAMTQVRSMLHDLNQMLRDRAAGKEPDFEGFMNKHGHMFNDPKPRDLDELLKQMRQQMERIESMLQSLTPDQRRKL